jgi:hypothetical protein
MTPRRLLCDVADTAMGLKETYTADNGISDLRPTLMAYDHHGGRLVAVLMASAKPADVGLVAFAVTAAWQPWALGFVTEGYVRHPGDDEAIEALVVAVHARGHLAVSRAYPFRYLTDRVVEWGDEDEVEYGGDIVAVLDTAIDAEPIEGFAHTQARAECIDWLRETGCVVT